MEKIFAGGISGMFAMLNASVVGVPAIFAQADGLSMDIVIGIAERLGLGVVMAILGYKIIIKMIDVFGPPLLERLNNHDAEMKEKLSGIRKSVERIDDHVSGTMSKDKQAK